MHDRHVLIEHRLQRVLGERITPAVHTPVAVLGVQAWHVGDGSGEPVVPAVALGLDPAAAAAAGVVYEPFLVGDTWGPAWATTWFHLTGVVPEHAGQGPVELLVDLGWDHNTPGMQAEGLVYRPDGSVVKALNPFNRWVPLEGGPGTPIDVYVEAASNPNLFDGPPLFQRTEQGSRATASPAPLARLVQADIAVLHPQVQELAADLDVLGELQAALPLGEPRRWKVLDAIDRALDAVDLRDIAGSAAAARAELAGVLARPASASAHVISAVGHAHIDSAWLWPVRETVRKVARTASNVVDLLDREPDLVYAMSSAQQFAWLQEHRPEVFARVRKAVDDGRFVPVGGMWVESDTTMVGSESLVRQFTHGQRYFEQELGVRSEEVWLPDTFGYSAALPQIVHLAGMRWFLTQKISWNRTNPFPHHTFWWEGIDGTRVFTHFPPADTYSGTLGARELAHTVANFRDKGRSDHSLLPFGYGDGGGGPTREMLARARRARDLEGLPRVLVRTPAEFFTDARAEAEHHAAPVWKGELYLELHRGTLTTQAAVKQGNRRCEHLFHEAELWAATAAVDDVASYPLADLDRLWKLLLLHQFHDMLPGTSIAWVHEETRERHAEVAAALEAIIERSQGALAGPGDAEVVFNGSPFARHGVPALGATADGPAAVPVARAQERPGGGVVLSSDLVRAELDADGLLVSIVDAASGREAVPAGQVGGLLQVHPDLPNEWDAWDIDAFYRHRVTDLRAAESLQVLPGPHGPVVEVVRRHGASTIVQRTWLAPGAARVDVEATVDWHEQEQLLKVAFPVDVHADSAAFETQFGHLVRPTHENTSWEDARFEVSAHRWVHVGEPGYGAVVVNDSTYGHEVTRHARAGGGSWSTLRLSLLRGPVFPDPQADQGTHRLRWSFAPGVDVAGAVEHGYDLNLPERRVRGGRAVPPLVAVEGPVVLETVKLADDGSGDLVVRLYEPRGARATARLTARVGLEGLRETDLHERDLDGSALTDIGQDGAELVLRPFQIITLRAAVAR